MATNDVDYQYSDDEPGNTGVITRRLTWASHIEILPSQWAGIRAAAVLGQSDFDAWIAANRPAADAAYYAAQPAAVKAGLRRACLRGAP